MFLRCLGLVCPAAHAVDIMLPAWQHVMHDLHVLKSQKQVNLI